MRLPRQLESIDLPQGQEIDSWPLDMRWIQRLQGPAGVLAR
jgi:hypothetical protein